MHCNGGKQYHSVLAFRKAAAHVVFAATDVPGGGRSALRRHLKAAMLAAGQGRCAHKHKQRDVGKLSWARRI